MKIELYSRVAINKDIPAGGLKRGDVGTVVMIHKDGLAYEVEFMTFAGDTLAVETLEATEVRPVGGNAIPSARELEGAVR